MLANISKHMPRACVRERRALRPALPIMAALATAFLFAASTAEALTPRSPKIGATIVIKNDYGGSVRKRYEEIQVINQKRQKVEIRGHVCISSCTMYLGAKNVCVSPKTTFGFHGPYRFGARLTSAEFDQWSNVISSHYPSSVRSWYMQKARHQTSSITRVKGSELIRMGVSRCK